jgi:hypothetical protein
VDDDFRVDPEILRAICAYRDGLKVGVETAISSISIKVDGLICAINLLTKLLEVSGAISRADLEANAKQWANNIKDGMWDENEIHRQGAAMVFLHCLEIGADSESKVPSMNFQIIKGGKDDREN